MDIDHEQVVDAAARFLQHCPWWTDMGNDEGIAFFRRHLAHLPERPLSVQRKLTAVRRLRMESVREFPYLPDAWLNQGGCEDA